MSQFAAYRVALCLGAGSLFVSCGTLWSQTSGISQELRELREQNLELKKQLQQQQGMIEALSRKVDQMERPEGKEKSDGHSEPEDGKTDSMLTAAAASTLGRINISGEGGVVFLHSGPEGMFPNNEFRLDEARLFVEAPVFKNVYFYGELNLATREEPDVQARVGELYLDVENLSQLWSADHQLNLRAGRMYIPFGEEYSTRYAIDNPFVSHSLSDIWGIDEGLELYGHAGKFSYAAAIQNGGLPDVGDFTSDKSLAGRVSFDPSTKVHLSVSGMRTGTIDVSGEHLSALWFGNGFFRSIGSSGTSRFQAELVEGDVLIKVPGGHFSAFGGYAHYHDNDPSGHNSRDLFYYSFEAVHDMVGKFYGAVRFSQILPERGYPIVGNGSFGDYFFGPLTTDLWRLSFDLGYRWNRNLLLKAEYSFERGRTLDGKERDSEDLLALEAAFRF